MPVPASPHASAMVAAAAAPASASHLPRRVAVVVLTVALFATAGVQVARALGEDTAHNRGVILFVGDSNTIFGAGATTYEMQWAGGHHYNGYAPVFLGHSGAGIRHGDCAPADSCPTSNYWKIKLGETFPKVQPDFVVVSLGTNDARRRGTPTTLGYAAYGDKIDWFMRLLPAGQKVLWTNLPCAIEPADRLTGCLAVNATLAKARQRWPRLVVLDWASRANPHPEYMKEGQAHYSKLGYAVWAEFVVAALDARLPVPA